MKAKILKNIHNPDWKIFAYDEVAYDIKKYIKIYYGDDEAKNPCYDIYNMAKYIIDEREKRSKAITKSMSYIIDQFDRNRGINIDYNGKDDMDDRKN